MVDNECTCPAASGAEEAARAKIFLYGGCVLRDSFESVKDRASLAGYVSRQSLVSAAHGRSRVTLPRRLESPFQQRMVEGDIKASLFPTIKEALDAGIDRLVIDHNIERNGVYRLPGDTYMTRSAEAVKAGLLEIPSLRHLDPFSTEFQKLWKLAARRLVFRLQRWGLLERTVVVETPWATEDSHGQALPETFKRPLIEMSGLISGFAEYLESQGVRRVRMPDELAVADAEHQWGPAPFHYTSEATDWLAREALGVR